jgi:hypothetical protein
MHREEKLKLRSHITSYCIIEVVTEAGLTVYTCMWYEHRQCYLVYGVTVDIILFFPIVFIYDN